MDSVANAKTLAEYLELPLPARPGKPRTRGLTMVMDQGWPWEFADGMLDQFGAYLDVVKLWDPHLGQPVDEVKRKIDAYRAHDVRVQTGGLFLEIARKRNREKEVARKLVDLGCDVIEISSTTSTRSDNMEKDLEFIAYAQSIGLKVIGEVGRKFADGDETRLTENTLDIKTTIREFNVLLRAGAWKVYWEGHLLRKVLGDDPETIKAQAATGTAQVMAVVESVGQDNIFFEVSGLRPRQNRQWLQFWLIRLFGPDVNLANARIEELGSMEALRAGNHPIFGFGSSGNYPWVRAIESGTGDGWWRT